LILFSLHYDVIKNQLTNPSLGNILYRNIWCSVV